MSDDARGAVLGRLRRSLGRTDSGADAARQVVGERLANPRPGIIPARADLDLPGRVALFTSQAEAVQTTVQRLRGYAQIPAAVVDYVRAKNLPMRLVMAADPALDRAPWPAMLEIRRGRAEDADAVGLTTAFAGIAETGTLMLLSDRAHPTTLAFLPETSIIVLATDRVLRAYEDGLRLLRQEQEMLPRSINLVTGPSRSGDIEQTIQLGAHGPKRLLA
ncbi:MAG: LutC/YkgG family protein, partial [Geminicoccaceae bacterium]